MDYPALQAELATGHPGTGPYNADDTLAAGELNAENRSVSVANVTGKQIMDATNDTEFAALTDNQKLRWLSLCSHDYIDTASGVAKAEEDDIFGVGTTTRTNLVALKTQTISRAVELDLGYVRPGDVQYARSLP